MLSNNRGSAKTKTWMLRAVLWSSVLLPLAVWGYYSDRASRWRASRFIEAEAARAGVPPVFELRADGLEIKLRFIPAGEFTTFATADGPPRQVKFDTPFYMSETEITQRQFAQIVNSNPSTFMGGDYPVETAIREDGRLFCRKLSERTGQSVRLPTEDEWEYACRAGQQTRFDGSDSESALAGAAWYKPNSKTQTHTVRTKSPNAWGLYDMRGNVWEWCETCGPLPPPSENPFNRLHATPYIPKPPFVVNPPKEELGVTRGGSFMDEAHFCGADARATPSITFRNSNIGFRIVVDLPVKK